MEINFNTSKPDARILILQIIIAAFLSFYLENKVALVINFLVINCVVFILDKRQKFFRNLCTYIAINILIWGLINFKIPIISDIFPSFLTLFIKIFPIYILIKLFIDRTPMNDLLYSLDLIKIPKTLSIPIMVVYRYAPTIMREVQYINESLKMRGLNLKISNLRYPLRTLENYIVPLLFRSEKIAEELSAASLCKGLSVERNRTCCTEVRLTAADAFYLLGIIAITCILMYINSAGFNWR